MTEIQFLLDLILTGKLSKAAKEKCLSRIGEVEKQLAERTQPVQRPAIQAQIQQTPSMQRIMEQQGAPIVGPIMGPPGKVDRETGSIMVNNGDGTVGKRKW